MNSLLYGTGTKKILATETVPNQTNMSQVWYADGSSEYIPYKNFIYLNSQDPVIDSLYDNTDIQELFGSNHFDCIVHTDNWGLINYIKNNAKDYYLPFLQSQWMIQSGETQFKGMDFDEPLRWYIDIEVYSTYEFTNAQREEDRVIMIAVCDNKGWKRLWRVDEFESEPDMIDNFIKTLRKHDPTVLILHNGFGYDMPYFRDRCLFHGVKFQIGRDGSEPNTFTTSIKFAEKSDEYENFQVYGRHVLDTMFMAKAYDQVARKLEGYGLKYCAKFLGREQRVEIDGDDIASAWNNTHPKWTREDLAKYAMDDVYDTKLLDENWGRTIFETTKMFALPMQDVSRYGTGNKIESLFSRYYYQNLWSYPKPDPRESYGGGYTGVFTYGYINEPSIYIDVSSLYPTVMALLNIQPPKDELELFQKLLQLVRDERMKKKAMAQEAKKDGREDDFLRLNGEQNALKIILNSFYGFLGYQWGNFNYYKGASDTTEWGRKIAKQMNIESEKLGGKVIRTDTDGSLVIVPQEFRGNTSSEMKFIKMVEDKVNEWLETKI